MRRVLTAVAAVAVVAAGCGGPEAERRQSAPPTTVGTGSELDAQTARDRHLVGSQPDLATVPPRSARSGEAVERFAITATDTDSACADLRFTAVHLPAGLALRNRGDCTATVQGRLAARPDRYPVVYSVTDETGNADSTTSIFTVRG